MSRKEPIKINISDDLNVKSNGVFHSKVVKSGNGAVINFYKRFVGEEVIIIRVNKMGEKQNKETDVTGLNKKEQKEYIKRIDETEY